jgi:anti-sigma regulatory factor (Ser/Thr protein kinase)
VSSVAEDTHRHTNGFQHEALLYAGMDEFLVRCAAFIEDGLARGEAVMAAVARPKIDRLRERLGERSHSVVFADMNQVGANPARIIPIWRQFADRHAPTGARGIGEPISPARGVEELTECQRHEALINVAFDNGHPWRLACPYDTSALPPEVIEEALRSHPLVSAADGQRRSSSYDGGVTPFEGTLPEPATAVAEHQFGGSDLAAVRRRVSDSGRRAGLEGQRLRNLVLSVSEVAANSIRHGGGHGLLRIWREGDVLFCEVKDSGRIGEPLAGRVIPLDGRRGGRGLWIANQLCDLVQIRCSDRGTVVRIQARLG